LQHIFSFIEFTQLPGVVLRVSVEDIGEVKLIEKKKKASFAADQAFGYFSDQRGVYCSSILNSEP
jgi:hypothetical protein